MISIKTTKKDSLSPSANCDKLSCKGSGVSALSNDTPLKPKFQVVVSPFLLHGKENALSIEKLCELLGLSSPRFVRKLIKDEREHGFMILATSGGYFLPSEDSEQGHAEMLKCYRWLLAKSTSTFPFLRILERKLKVSPFQLELFPEGGDEDS